MSTNNTSDDDCKLPPTLPPLQPPNKRRKTIDGSVGLRSPTPTTEDMILAMFAQQREHGLPENNITKNPVPTATAKIKGANVGGGKSVGMSRKEARAICGQLKQDFTSSRARAISISKKRKYEETPSPIKYKVSSTNGSWHQLCKVGNCTNQAMGGGVCITHGATKKRCKAENCTNQAQQGGVCKKHGAKKKLCKVENVRFHVIYPVS